MAWLVLAAATDTVRSENVLQPQTVVVAAGFFVSGSDAKERESAYTLDEKAYGHSITRQQGWYDREAVRGERYSAAFAISATPVTNSQYAAFVRETGHPAPDVDAKTWASYRLAHPFKRTRRFAWIGNMPPVGRGDHPVVLVSHGDALAYAAWLTKRTGTVWRLPTDLEWEKAGRGIHGNSFPWGDRFDPNLLNSHDKGPFDTMPVGQFPQGASPFGMLDAAGQVYEWTATPAVARAGGPDRFVVKGGSWDDKGCGVCRPAAWHGRPGNLKHILIGFRLTHDIAD